MPEMHRCTKEMENDSLLQCTEEQCCPVCQRPLSMPPCLKTCNLTGNGKKVGALKLDLKKMASAKLKVDGNLVVSAMCGHLFHKFCLRHYCYTYRQGGINPVDKVECPVCFQFVSMTKIQVIDYKIHRKITAGYEKAYRHTLILNKELSDQKESAFKKLTVIENGVEEISKKLQTYRVHECKLVDKTQETMFSMAEKEKVYSEIEDATKALDMMHKENMELVKMYLSIMKDKPLAELRNKRVPEPLIPYLAIIQGDEKLMRKFGEILKPVEIDGLRSNTQVLIQEILADVKPKAEEEKQMKSMQVTDLPKHFKLKRNKENPVVVKVHRSSLSIFSRTVLTEESLQQIMKHVKAPIKFLKEANKKHTKLTETVHRSVSEIEVLFEPRKRQTESETLKRLPYEDSDCEFGGKDLVPVRKCRSTEPILMKNYIKGPKALIVKMEYLKQNIILGDAKDFMDSRKDNGLSNCGDNERQVVFPPTPIDSQVNKVAKFAQNGNNRELHETPCTPYPNGSKSSNIELSLNSRRTSKKFQISAEQGDVRATTSVGFDTTVKASVLELLFENIVDDDKISSSLVDEVSKRTFRNITQQSVFDFDVNSLEEGNMKSEVFNGIVEYKIDAHGHVMPFSEQVKGSQGNGNKGESDIESGIKVGELPPQLHSTPFPPSNYLQSLHDDKKMASVLKGILPGPYRNPVVPTIRPKPPHMYPRSNGNENLPDYLSNWVSKLPSARVGAAYVTPIPTRPEFPPPPPISKTIPPGAQVSNTLPPLPKTPPPMKPTSICKHQAIPSYNYCTKNRPFGDDVSETNASYYKKFPSLRDTVIEIPSSNACLHNLEYNPHCQQISTAQRSRNTNAGNSRTTLPPLPDEGFLYERVYMLKTPAVVAPRISQKVLTQPVIKIIMHPKYSSSNMTRSRSQRFLGCTQQYNQSIKPFQLREPSQLEPSRFSQERSVGETEYNSPSIQRDIPSTEGYMHRNCDYFNSKNRNEMNVYTGVTFVENALSKLCSGLSPPEDACFRKNSPIDHDERHYFGPLNGVQFFTEKVHATKPSEEGNVVQFLGGCSTLQNEPPAIKNEIKTMDSRVVRRARRRHNLNV